MTVDSGSSVISKLVDPLKVQMLWLLIVPLSEIEGCGVITSFCIKMMQQRAFQVCNLNFKLSGLQFKLQSSVSKKGHAFCFGQSELI